MANSKLLQVQEAADCLGADCMPRYVETKQLKDLDVQDILSHSNKASNFHFNLPISRCQWVRTNILLMNKFDRNLLMHQVYNLAGSMNVKTGY